MSNPAAKILIVDDEIRNRKLLEALLHSEGYATMSAASGTDALAAVAQHAPDLVLLDVMMPDMDGFQVARKLKSDASTSHIPIIMVTASADRHSRLAGLESGAEDFLNKPVDRAELWLRVRNLLRVKAYGDLLQNQSLLLEQQVQARTASLLESERRFSTLLRDVELAAVMFDREARITFCNAHLLRLTGWTSDEIVGRSLQEVFLPHEDTETIAALTALLDDAPDAWHRENEILTRSGERRLMRWSNSLLRSSAGDVIGSASIGEDITEQKRAEAGIKRLNRVYAVLSRINTLIVRVRDRAELFKETCRIAVVEGGFRMALVALVDQGTKQIATAASMGVDDELLNGVKNVFSSRTSVPSTMVARAISEKRAVVSNDSQNDPQVRLGVQHAAAGVRSIAVLPLIVSDEAVGTLVLYASEIEFFHADELKLLAELAGDVAFAIDHIEKQAKFDYLAYYDALTGLCNRTLFHETLKLALAQASDSGRLVALLCIDLDLFKNVNDTLGHALGDDLLRQFGIRLARCVRSQDTVGRLGGDEFALILSMQKGKDNAVLVANTIRDALREPFDLRGHEVTVTASIGITIHPDDAGDAETLMKYADTAMYGAKQAGRDTFRFFTAQMNTEVLARLELEQALRKALANDEFVLHYQPKVQLRNGRVGGFEALLRWQRPGSGLVMPHAFIPALEEMGLIVSVGSWVISSACKQVARWTESAGYPVQVSVNVSGRQLVEGDLEGDVAKALADSGIAADQLELELTESSLMANTESNVLILRNLKKRGVQISIDDFGTGYSSLAYLRRFPIDTLKIDIAFIRDVASSPDAASIVRAIVQMAHSLKMEVIAEGVETAAQLSYLRRNGCDQIQGYYFSKPLPLPEAEKMLSKEKRMAVQDVEIQRSPNTLLLVDDEANILSTLKRMFHKDDYNILCAGSAAEGFELLALHEVQVILCDQRMPVMNGTEFLDRVKEMYPDTLRIILSGYTDLNSIIDAINRGSIYRFYTKPWDNKEMRENIQSAFRHYWLLRAGSSIDAAVTPGPQAQAGLNRLNGGSQPASTIAVE